MSLQATLRLRLSNTDSHYAGELVAGAKILELFGDVATELTIIHDGDEGLLRSYENVEFLAPVYAGDFLEVSGKITKTGKTSRTISFEAYKVITPAKDAKHPSACDVLEQPILVARATGTCVVTEDKQRN